MWVSQTGNWILRRGRVEDGAVWGRPPLLCLVGIFKAPPSASACLRDQRGLAGGKGRRPLWLAGALGARGFGAEEAQERRALLGGSG